jgi:hypothetical protein
MQAANQQRQGNLVNRDAGETHDAEATQAMGPPAPARACGKRSPPLPQLGAGFPAHAD